MPHSLILSVVDSVVVDELSTKMWMWRWIIVAMSICLVCQSRTNNCGHNPLQAMMEIANNTGMLTWDISKHIGLFFITWPHKLSVQRSTWPPFTTMIVANRFRNCPVARWMNALYYSFATFSLIRSLYYSNYVTCGYYYCWVRSKQRKRLEFKNE